MSELERIAAALERIADALSAPEPQEMGEVSVSQQDYVQTPEGMVAVPKVSFR